MAELRIGVANGGLTINGVSNMGTGGTSGTGGAPVQAAPLAQASAQSAGSAVTGAIEAAVAPGAQAPAQVPAQGVPIAPAIPASPPAASAPPGPVSPVPSAATWQVPPSNPVSPVPAPLDPPSPPSQAAYAAPALAAGPPVPLLQPVTQDTSHSDTSLSSASAAAIAVPLTIVALAILVLAGLVFWYKRHPDRSSPLLRRRSTRRRRIDEESYSSEKSLFASESHPEFGRSGTTRGVTVTPHIEPNILRRPEPSIAPSIATSRRPTALSLSKPLPPISEYSCGSNSSAGEGSYTSVPVIHAATLGRRADAKYLQQHRYTAHPTIREEGSEMASETEDGTSTLAPNSPVSVIKISRSKGKSSYSNERRSSRGITGHNPSSTKLKRNPPSVYSTQTAPLPRRPFIPSTHSYARSLPTSSTRPSPARSETSATNSTAPSSPGTTDSDSLPEVADELPADHPFAQTYTATAIKLKSRSSTKASTSDVDGESMIRSITAQTELTLPWGFAEARKIRPIRQESRSEGAKLFREDTRKGEDWAREKLSSYKSRRYA